MRYITIPADISLINTRTKEKLDLPPKGFVDYAYEVWFNDTRISEKGPIKVRRWMKMVEAFDGKTVGEFVSLEDADWEMLREVVKEPKAFYPPLVTAQFDPFFTAVDSASTKVPKEPDPPSTAEG